MTVFSTLCQHNTAFFHQQHEQPLIGKETKFVYHFVLKVECPDLDILKGCLAFIKCASTFGPCWILIQIYLSASQTKQVLQPCFFGMSNFSIYFQTMILAKWIPNLPITTNCLFDMLSPHPFLIYSISYLISFHWWLTFLNLHLHSFADVKRNRTYSDKRQVF